MKILLFYSSPNVSINGNDTDHDEAATSDQEKTDLGKFQSYISEYYKHSNESCTFLILARLGY